jgi:hypothetical protein
LNNFTVGQIKAPGTKKQRIEKNFPHHLSTHHTFSHRYNIYTDQLAVYHGGEQAGVAKA